MPHHHPVFEDEDTKAVRMANAQNYLVAGNFSVHLIIHALLNIEACVGYYSSVCQIC